MSQPQQPGFLQGLDWGGSGGPTFYAPGQAPQQGVSRGAISSSYGQQPPGAGWGQSQQGQAGQVEGAPGYYSGVQPYTPGTIGVDQNRQPFNFMTPGAGERFYASHAASYDTPGAGQNFAGASLARYGQQGTPQTTMNAASAYQGLQGRMPVLAEDPGLDPYYQRARTRAREDIDTAMAARGMYGSGAAMDMTQEAMGQLGAEQANREAEYNLARLAEQRGWEGLAGSMAGAADQSSLARSQNEMAWLGQLANLGFTSEQLAQASRMQGMSAASAAQDAERLRGRDFMADVAFGIQATQPWLAEGYDQLLAGDERLLDASMGAEAAALRESYNQSIRRAERNKADANFVKDFAFDVGAGAMGG